MALNSFSVEYNTGSSFTAPVLIVDDQFSNESQHQATSYNYGATIAPFIPIIFTSIKLDFNGSRQNSTSVNKTLKTIADFDGDGYPDLLFTTNNGQTFVKYSNIRRTNMLKTVQNPLGGSFTLDYEVKGKTYDLPQTKWVMKSLEVNDGYTVDENSENSNDDVDGYDIYIKHFDYHNGKYDRRERMFFGFETIRSIDAKPDFSGYNIPTGEEVYRQSIEKYHNKNYFLQGLIKETWMVKGDFEINDLGEFEIPTNQIYQYTTHDYELYKPNYNAENHYTIDFNQVLSPDYDQGGQNGRGSAFVLLKQTENHTYNAQNLPPLISSQKFEHDEFGRIIEFKNFAENAHYLSQINYFSPTDNQDFAEAYENHNIISIPKDITVYSSHNPSNAFVLRKREISQINDLGEILEIVTHLGMDVDGNNQGVAATNMTYNDDGLLSDITYPKNLNSERLRLEYSYDNLVHTYPIKVNSSVLLGGTTLGFMNYLSSSTYDVRYGALTQSIDISGNSMTYEYDNFGRIKTIKSPKEIATNTPFTIKFEYFPLADIPYAKTYHYDVQNPTNFIETITFSDGLARPMQVKKDIAYYDGTNATEKMSVSGWIKYDAYGRAVEQFHPSFEDKVTENNILNTDLSNYSSTTVYDALDRPISQFDPAGTESTLDYSISSNRLVTTHKIYNDQLTIQNESFVDVNGRTLLNRSLGPDGYINTEFIYDPIGQLVKVLDHEQNETISLYDMAGRRIQMSHPDAGINKYWYDEAGNLVYSQTPNLAEDNERIGYLYEYNRLVEMIFPELPNAQPNPANVIYKFGEQGNGAGKVIYQEDATGIQLFKYDDMGSVLYTERKVVTPDPSQTPVIFWHEFHYDSWNRIQQLIYPDGEKVDYSYDVGGNLLSMHSQDTNYIDFIGYDEYEQKVYQLYGNQTESTYAYEPELRRLKNMQALAQNGEAMFDNFYTFDKVGNITEIFNTADFNSINAMGGKVEHFYQYDELNRLVEAQGSFDGIQAPSYQGNHHADYRLQMSYDNLHRIIGKTQEHKKDNFHWADNTYENIYQYSNQHQPHAVQQIEGEQAIQKFKYDANGNMIAHQLSSLNTNDCEDAMDLIITRTSPTTASISVSNDQQLYDLYVVLHNNAGPSPGAPPNAHGANDISLPFTRSGLVPQLAYDVYIRTQCDAQTTTEWIGPIVLPVSLGTTPVFNPSPTDIDRSLYWDEVNRLRTIVDNTQNKMHHYLYDAGGERIMKGSGGIEAVYQNGSLVHETAWMGNYKMYPSAYVVLDANGSLTKHYYNGSERIASQLSRQSSLLSGLNQMQAYEQDEESLRTGIAAQFLEDIAKENLKFLPHTNKESIQQDSPSRVEIYYFHPDHLGTATYLSDVNGNPYQFFLNLPFGESMAEQRTGAFENLYKFNGKELDEETGLYYYGARYYDPSISIFISVDPLVEQTMDAYGYTYQNPINLVDPTGMGPEDFVQSGDGSIYWDKNAISQATTKEGETYLGKELTFIFKSYIDKKLWDGPLGSFPTGNKVTSTIHVGANTDAENNLLSINVSSDEPIIHKTGGIFPTDGYFPGQTNYSVNKSGMTSGNQISYEQHAKVNGFEEFGLGLMGYDKVNVAQKLTIGLNGNNISVTGSTDIFPSAILLVNGRQLFQYNQPSFKATHGVERILKVYRTPMNKLDDGVIPIYHYNHLRPAPAFYQRYSK